jgi:acylphosphatase
MIRVHIIITGIVQGVGFRYHTEKHARAKGLAGFVRNRADGSVEIEAQGNEALVNGFIDWVRHGVPRAVVSEVTSKVVPVTSDERNFEVKD